MSKSSSISAVRLFVALMVVATAACSSRNPAVTGWDARLRDSGRRIDGGRLAFRDGGQVDLGARPRVDRGTSDAARPRDLAVERDRGVNFDLGRVRGLSQDYPAAGCGDALNAGASASGLVWVRPAAGGAAPFQVFCDQQRNGGGWAMLYNSVLGTNTTEFWAIPYAERLGRRGTPGLTTNFYDGSLYARGLRFMDVVEDLGGKVALAMDAKISVPENFNPVTMRFFSPELLGGIAGVMNSHLGAGWSSSDYDGDTYPTGNCALVYANVTQHYAACWGYSLGSDADDPYYDQGVGPHMHKSLLAPLGLVGDGSDYSRVRRITRFVKW